MKKNRGCLLAVIIILLTCQGYTQQVAINEDGSLPNPHATLDIKSFNKGVLIRRMSTANRLGIPNTKGLLVYDTTIGSFWYNTGTLWQSLAGISTSGSSWLVTGNSGISEAHFLGTTDFKPLRIRVNDEPSGLLDPTNGNCFWGYNSGTFSNSDSVYFNTAAGYFSLHHNTAGSLNTTMGDYSMYSNTTGNANTAIGDLALYSNTTGSDNTAIGSFSLYSNTTGNFNTAIGSFSGVVIQNAVNATALGYGAHANASNKVRIGNSAVTAIEGAVPFTTPSDSRYKFNVQEDVKGLAFILQLRPVTYQFDAEKFDAQWPKPVDTLISSYTDEIKDAYTKASLIRRSGFIAQDVKKAADASGYAFSGLIVPAMEQEHYSLSYESYVVPLVKAVQELYMEVDRLKKMLQQKTGKK